MLTVTNLGYGFTSIDWSVYFAFIFSKVHKYIQRTAASVYFCSLISNNYRWRWWQEKNHCETFYSDKWFMNTPWLTSKWNKVTKTNCLSCLNTMIKWFILTCNKSHHCCIKKYMNFETVAYIWLLVENILFLSLIIRFPSKQ